MATLNQQSVTVARTDAATLVIPHLARQLIMLHAQRADVTAQVEELVLKHPLYLVLNSMPRLGFRTAAVIIAELSGKTFHSPAALASYAGLSPTTRQSGSSIKSEQVSHSGNKRLKRALFLSAFTVIHTDTVSQAYNDRKRDQGKHHDRSLIARAHHRLNVMYAMIKAGSLYNQPAPQAA